MRTYPSSKGLARTGESSNANFLTFHSAKIVTLPWGTNNNLAKVFI